MGYNKGFLNWIAFLRGGEIEKTMPRWEWADWLGPKLSSLNWKLIGQRLGVDTTGVSQSEAVVRLMVAYEQAGAPPGPAPKAAPPKNAADHVIRHVQSSVAP